MKLAKYSNSKKATAACCMRLSQCIMRASNYDGESEHPLRTKQIYLGDSWFRGISKCNIISFERTSLHWGFENWSFRVSKTISGVNSELQAAQVALW